MDNGYWGFPGGKAAEAWCYHPPPSKRRGPERVELYLYSPSGPQWPVIGRTFTFTFIKYMDHKIRNIVQASQKSLNEII